MRRDIRKKTVSGLTLMGALVGALVLTVSALASPAGAVGGPGGGGGGGGGGETTLGNNLSVPAVFVPDTSSAGAPVLRVPCTSASQSPQGPRASGYWLAGSDGGVFTYGSATFQGAQTGTLNAPVAGMAPTKSANGYWLVASDGGIFAFGDAGFYGSMGGKPLNAPIVGMAADPAGGGYWLVAADGGVFAFGSSAFYGSMGGTHLNAPIVGMAADPATGGYWLVAADGGVFAFGSAGFHGSMGGTHLNSPAVGIASTPSGLGYSLVASDGGLFAFGDAGFYGSMGGTTLNARVVGIASSPSGLGYLMVAADGGIFAFGDAPFYGSAGGTSLDAPMVGIAFYPGYWLQQTAATWSSYCTTATAATVTAQWGSNLTDSPQLHADKPIRVEVGLLDMAATGDPYLGYAITNLTPTLPDQSATYGTDGTTFLSGVNGGAQTRVWGPGATLNIRDTGTDSVIYNGPISAEINSTGAVVFGFNWGGSSSSTTDPAGTYELTFTIPSPITIDAVAAGTTNQPTFTSDSTTLTVTVS
ncbi:MAG TPA: hypothetical protein VND44_11545 [Acidimicrobiales bacterium]|nr:hypothetical protein [Acidimicrobiales bacterium]